MSHEFDPSRAMMRGPDLFERFRVPDHGYPLRDARLPADTELFVVERAGESRAFILREMSHPHVAQGELGGQPFMLVFCGVCHSAVGMTPVVDGQVRQFSAGGLYNGVVLITDDETGSYWELMTGECLFGPSQGAQLEVWPVEYTTAGQADPDVPLTRKPPANLTDRFMRWGRNPMNRKAGFLPPFFRKTMDRIDPRLPELERGLGVVEGERACFYTAGWLAQGPHDESWEGRTMRLWLGEDGIPRARWEDGTVPMSLFTRWYGFVAVYPDCEVRSSEP